MTDNTRKMYDEGGSPERRSGVQQSGVPSCLLHYYDNINDYPLMTPAEEAAMWDELNSMGDNVRNEISHFIFVLDEHERLIDECTDLDKVFDCFCESRLTDEERKDKTLVLRNLPAWKADIHDLRERMYKAYRSGKLSGKKRKALQEEAEKLLMRFPAARTKVGEWLFVAEFYVEQGAGTHVDPDDIRLTESPEENYKSVNFIRDCIDLYYTLRSKFVSANLRLVLGVVNKFNISYQQHPDLIQEGNLGLMLAFDKFDSRLGHKFSTYASWWIRRNITNAIPTQLRTIQIPPKMFQTLMQIRTMEEKLVTSKGEEPSMEELASALKMSVAKVHSLKMMMAQPLSLQSNINGDEDGWSPEDFLYDSETADPAYGMTMATLKEDLHAALSTLSEREQLIIKYHFGLDGLTPLKTSELAEKFSIPKEKLRRIERYALAKLRRKVANDPDDYK